MAKPTLQQAKKHGYEPRRLGAEVRRIREEKGLGQEDLAKAASVSKPALWRLEHGQVVPSLQILERIAGTLGVDLADLIRTGYDETASPASSTLKEIIYLAEGMTEAKRRLALDLLKVAARQKIS
jgi:transcriptional regulator with XRE-family HTH domain